MSHCTDRCTSTGSAAVHDARSELRHLAARSLREEAHDGVERLGLRLLGGQATEQVGHPRIGRLDGTQHGRVRHEGAKGRRVEVAREQLL